MKKHTLSQQLLLCYYSSIYICVNMYCYAIYMCKNVRYHPYGPAARTESIPGYMSILHTRQNPTRQPNGEGEAIRGGLWPDPTTLRNFVQSLTPDKYCTDRCFADSRVADAVIIVV